MMRFRKLWQTEVKIGIAIKIENALTPRWPRGMPPPPNRFFKYFLRNGKSVLLQTKFLAVGYILGTSVHAKIYQI